MKWKIILYALILLIVIGGCWQKKESSNHNSLIGQKICMPSKMKIYTHGINEDKDYIIKHINCGLGKNMILLYFRADCSSCIPKIGKWTKKAFEIEKKGYSTLIVLGANDHFELFKWIVENQNLDISYPVILDLSDDFLNNNHFKSGFNGPLVLDSHYRVIQSDFYTKNNK